MWLVWLSLKTSCVIFQAFGRLHTPSLSMVSVMIFPQITFRFWINNQNHDWNGQLHNLNCSKKEIKIGKVWFIIMWGISKACTNIGPPIWVWFVGRQCHVAFFDFVICPKHSNTIYSSSITVMQPQGSSVTNFMKDLLADDSRQDPLDDEIVSFLRATEIRHKQADPFEWWRTN